MGNKFLVKTFPEETIREMASLYISKDYTKISEIAQIYELGEKTISNLLMRGIAEYILGDATAEMVYSNFISRSPTQAMRDKLDKAFDAREEKKLQYKKYLQKLQDSIDKEFKKLDSLPKDATKEREECKKKIATRTPIAHRLSNYIKKQEHS